MIPAVIHLNHAARPVSFGRLCPVFLFDLVGCGCHARAEKKRRGGCQDFLEHVEFSPFGFKVFQNTGSGPIAFET